MRRKSGGGRQRVTDVFNKCPVRTSTDILGADANGHPAACSFLENYNEEQHRCPEDSMRLSILTAPLLSFAIAAQAEQLDFLQLPNVDGLATTPGYERWIQRQRQADLRRFDKPNHLRDHSFKRRVAADRFLITELLLRHAQTLCPQLSCIGMRCDAGAGAKQTVQLMRRQRDGGGQLCQCRQRRLARQHRACASDDIGALGLQVGIRLRIG